MQTFRKRWNAWKLGYSDSIEVAANSVLYRCEILVQKLDVVQGYDTIPYLVLT